MKLKKHFTIELAIYFDNQLKVKFFKDTHTEYKDQFGWKIDSQLGEKLLTFFADQRHQQLDKQLWSKLRFRK